jgi:hypothetical protein
LMKVNLRQPPPVSQTYRSATAKSPAPIKHLPHT